MSDLLIGLIASAAAAFLGLTAITIAIFFGSKVSRKDIRKHYKQTKDQNNEN